MVEIYFPQVAASKKGHKTKHKHRHPDFIGSIIDLLLISVPPFPILSSKCCKSTSF